MRSLRARLSVAFVLIAILHTVLSATFASYEAHRAFRQYVERGAERDGRTVVSVSGATGAAITTTQGPIRRPFGAREVLFSSRIRNGIWGATLIAAGLGVLVALWIANRIGKPVAELTRATRAIARGGPAPLVPVTGRDEMAELGQAFNHMAAQLAEEEQQRRRLFAGIAHELRTPLAVIQGTL